MKALTAHTRINELLQSVGRTNDNTRLLLAQERFLFFDFEMLGKELGYATQAVEFLQLPTRAVSLPTVILII